MERHRRINKNNFVNFIDLFIKDKYKGHVLLLDNAVFHKAKEVKNKILETENNYLYSVRYRPNTNIPIEGFLIS